MVEEIEKQRKQVLTREEYIKVQNQFKEKGVKRVPLFIADERTMHTRFTLVSFHRMINLFNVGYVGIVLYNSFIFMKIVNPELLYSCTAGITVMNLLYAYYLRKLNSTHVNRIEWDVGSEQFVIVRPRGLFKETQDMLMPHELKMDAKSKDKDCIYFDAITGQGIATVNRG